MHEVFETSRRLRGLWSALVFLLAAETAAAHDFWIEPSTFRPAPGEEFTVALRVGEHFRGEPVPRDERRIKKFFLVSNRGESPIRACRDPIPRASRNPTGPA